MLDKHGTFDAPTQDELDLMQPRVLAFMFPNTPTTERQISVFDKAVAFQIAHEKSLIAAVGETDLPPNATGFKIGNFSMEFAEGSFNARLTKQTICPTVYGLLLREGLLYRGVEGRCLY